MEKIHDKCSRKWKDEMMKFLYNKKKMKNPSHIYSKKRQNKENFKLIQSNGKLVVFIGEEEEGDEESGSRHKSFSWRLKCIAYSKISFELFRNIEKCFYFYVCLIFI